MLVPQDRGIVLWTLRYGDEVATQKRISTISKAVKSILG